MRRGALFRRVRKVFVVSVGVYWPAGRFFFFGLFYLSAFFASMYYIKVLSFIIITFSFFH